LVGPPPHAGVGSALRLALSDWRSSRSGRIALAFAVLAVLGIQRIQIDDSLSQLFHSESPAFKLFEQVSHDFPSSEYDVMIVVTGDTLLDRDSAEKLRSLVTDAQLIEGTRGVVSMFSARQPAPEGGLPEAVFSEPLPQGSGSINLYIIHGRLLWTDGRLALPRSDNGRENEKYWPRSQSCRLRVMI
jgi:hypothetical protein